MGRPRRRRCTDGSCRDGLGRRSGVRVFADARSGCPAFYKPLAFAASTLLFAALFIWRGWRIWTQAALFAAGVALLHGFQPTYIPDETAFPWRTLLLFGACAGAFFSAATWIRRRAPRNLFADGLVAAAILSALFAFMVALRWLGAGSLGAPLTMFAEASLRAFGLVAAGFLSVPRYGVEAGVITRWRGHVLMGLGFLYALMAPATSLHPWWGQYAIEPTTPLLNLAALSFIGMAALALLAARRFAERPTVAICYAITGGLLAAICVVTEIRRLFAAPEMYHGEIGLVEGACYALAALMGALIVSMWARGRGPALRNNTDALALFGIAIAALFLLVLRHPWWGGHDGAVTTSGATMLAVFAQAGAGLLTLAVASQLRAVIARQIAGGAALALALSTGFTALRWLHHQAAMDDGAAFIGVESLYCVLWPLAFAVCGAGIANTHP